MMRLALLLLCLAIRPAFGQAPSEVVDRRSRLSAAHPDGLIILKANALEKGMTQPSWIQDPAFQYFSGLSHVPGGILVIAPNQTVLFAGPAPESFGLPIDALDVMAHPQLAARGDFDQVLSWSEFVPWMEKTLPAHNQTVYLDQPRRPSPAGVPPGMRPVQGSHTLWAMSLEDAFPDASFSSAAQTIRGLRWQKSETEVRALRENARASAAALIRGMKSVRPGMYQRMAESEVVSGCLEEGADGPSFWPWMMSGPNAHIGRLVQSFFDNHNLNRKMWAGELLRADVGCAGGGFGGDVGRTVPVSGAFTADQALVWDLMVVGYLAGIEAMRDRVSLDVVREASRRAIQSAGQTDTRLGEVAAAMNGPAGINWHIHGVGIESGEAAVDPLVEGAVIAYEPGFTWGDDAYYLEDMILITSERAEVLTIGLPYTSEEIAALLRR